LTLHQIQPLVYLIVGNKSSALSIIANPENYRTSDDWCAVKSKFQNLVLACASIFSQSCGPHATGKSFDASMLSKKEVHVHAGCRRVGSREQGCVVELP